MHHYGSTLRIFSRHRATETGTLWRSSPASPVEIGDFSRSPSFEDDYPRMDSWCSNAIRRIVPSALKRENAEPEQSMDKSMVGVVPECPRPDDGSAPDGGGTGLAPSGSGGFGWIRHPKPSVPAMESDPRQSVPVSMEQGFKLTTWTFSFCRPHRSPARSGSSQARRQAVAGERRRPDQPSA